VLEQLIKANSNLDITIALVKKFSSDAATVAMHPSGSRVLQTLLRKVHSHITGKAKEDESSALLTLQKAVESFCDALSEAWPDVIYDVNGSHVIQSLIALLAGVEEEPQQLAQYPRAKQNNSRSPLLKILPTPKEFDSHLTSIIATIIESLQKCSSLAMAALYPQPCSVLVFFLSALHAHPMLQTALATKYIQPLLFESDAVVEDETNANQEIIPDESKESIYGSAFVYSQVSTSFLLSYLF
jgi:hypothetical protein